MSSRKIRVRQIYFDDKQRLFGMAQTKDFEPYYNEQADHFLESGVIADLYTLGDWVRNDYYGVVSHKFYSKIKKSSDFVLRKMEEDGYNSEVYSFFDSNPKVNVVHQAETWHKGFIEIYEKIGKAMEWNIDFRDKSILMEPIFSNHWIASRKVFKKYCKDYLLPVMFLVESDTELRKLCFEDSNYISKSKASPEKCLSIFGKPYYTFHPFIFERLFPVFCYIEDIEVKHV